MLLSPLLLKYQSRRALLLISSVMWCASGAWAMDLLQAYTYALDQNPAILAARATTAAEHERIPQARAQLLPNISASFSRTQNNLTRENPSAFQTPEERYVSDNRVLTLRQPLFRLYQWAQYQQVGFQARAATADLEKDIQDLAARIAGAYFEVLLADDNLALVLAEKKLYSLRLDAARKGLTAGTGTRTDIDDAQARLDMNVAAELEARQNQEYMRNQLQIMINDPVTELSTLDLEKMPLIPPHPATVDEWRNLAEEHSPEYQALQSRLNAASAAVDMARAGHYPTVDAIAQYSRNLSETIYLIDSINKSKIIGLQMSIPLFSSGSVNAAVRQSQALLESTKQTIEAKRREISLQVQKEFRNITEGQLKIKALEQAERSAVQLILSNRKSFEAGVRTRLDILNAEQQHMSILSDLARQRYIYLLSHIRLWSLAGQVTMTRMEEMNSWLHTNGQSNSYSEKVLTAPLP